MTGKGFADRTLTDDEAREIVHAAVDAISPDGASVLVIVPDSTRTCPLPMIARQLHRALAGRASRLDFLIALGTHPPMSDEQIHKLFGVEGGTWEEVLPGSKAFNHEWQNPVALRHVGTLTADQVDRISGGLFRMDVNVDVNAADGPLSTPRRTCRPSVTEFAPPFVNVP